MTGSDHDRDDSDWHALCYVSQNLIYYSDNLDWLVLNKQPDKDWMTVAMCIWWPETVETDKTDKQELYIVDLLPCTTRPLTCSTWIIHCERSNYMYTLQLQ